jgi:hypothetical protein
MTNPAHPDTDTLPRTKAGRDLADRASEMWWQPNPLAGANAMQSATRDIRVAILAIEDEAATEAAPLDVELDRLADRLGSEWAAGAAPADVLSMSSVLHHLAERFRDAK